MTVAALLFAKTFPIVITDHLISREGASGTPVDTALTDAESRASDSGHIPVGMAAKMWHVRDSMYMVYAGTVAHAQQICEKIAAKTTYEAYSSTVHADVVTWAEVTNLKASFILIFLGDDGFVTYYSHGARRIHNDFFGEVLIIGSGSEPLARSIEAVCTYADPLPSDFDLQVLAYVHRAMANATALQAGATVDYTKANSAYASKATGGLFALSYLPKCYGWSDSTLPPGHLQNRTCELFTESRGGGIYLNRAVISSRTIDEEPLKALVYRDSKQSLLNIEELNLLLAHEDWSDFHIAQMRSETTILPLEGLSEAQDVYAVIVYIKIKMKQGSYYVHKVFHQTGESLINISDTGTNLNLSFSAPLLRQAWGKYQLLI